MTNTPQNAVNLASSCYQDAYASGAQTAASSRPENRPKVQMSVEQEVRLWALMTVMHQSRIELVGENTLKEVIAVSWMWASF